MNELSSNMSYPIITQHCNDLAIGAESSLLTNENLQTGVKISYPGFNFVSSADTASISMGLKCTVSFRFFFQSSSNFISRLLFVMQTISNPNAHLAVKNQHLAMIPRQLK